jgi:hypothetical protein
MAHNVDLSKLNKDDLTHLIDEATNLRTTKFEGMDVEKDNEKQGEALAEEFEQEQAFGASGGD